MASFKKMYDIYKNQESMTHMLEIKRQQKLFVRVTRCWV